MIGANCNNVVGARVIYRQDSTSDLEPKGSKSRLPSLRMRLLLIVFALLVPTFAAAALALYTGYYRDRQEIQKHLLETGRALSLVLDHQFGQAEALLWALAASPILQTRDHAAFDALARRATRIPDAWIVVEEPGRQVVAYSQFYQWFCITSATRTCSANFDEA